MKLDYIKNLITMLEFLKDTKDLTVYMNHNTYNNILETESIISSYVELTTDSSRVIKCDTLHFIGSHELCICDDLLDDMFCVGKIFYFNEPREGTDNG